MTSASICSSNFELLISAFEIYLRLFTNLIPLRLKPFVSLNFLMGLLKYSAVFMKVFKNIISECSIASVGFCSKFGLYQIN